MKSQKRLLLENGLEEISDEGSRFLDPKIGNDDFGDLAGDSADEGSGFRGGRDLPVFRISNHSGDLDFHPVRLPAGTNQDSDVDILIGVVIIFFAGEKLLKNEIFSGIKPHSPDFAMNAENIFLKIPREGRMSLSGRQGEDGNQEKRNPSGPADPSVVRFARPFFHSFILNLFSAGENYRHHREAGLEQAGPAGPLILAPAPNPMIG